VEKFLTLSAALLLRQALLPRGAKANVQRGALASAIASLTHQFGLCKSCYVERAQTSLVAIKSRASKPCLPHQFQEKQF